MNACLLFGHAFSSAVARNLCNMLTFIVLCKGLRPTRRESPVCGRGRIKRNGFTETKTWGCCWRRDFATTKHHHAKKQQHYTTLH